MIADPLNPVAAEAVLRRFLQVVVDRQLQPLAFGRRQFLALRDFASEAVDDHFARAVLAHQQVVVGLLDAGLPDHARPA